MKTMVSPIVVTAYTLIPMIISIFGGILASFFVAKSSFKSFFQHLLAGIVVGAVAIELLPKIINQGHKFSVSIGFLAGVILMFLVHELSHFLAHKQKQKGLPMGLITGAIIDLFVDGVLIGIAFLAGTASGLLIIISLSFCAFFVNLTVATTMKNAQILRKKIYGVSALIAIMLPIGAFVGSFIVAKLPPIILTDTLAFGVAALLYLGVEELIGEAHGSAQHESPLWICGAFFLGFLAILLIKA